MSDLVRVDRRPDGVAVVRLDNGKVNALSQELLRQLEAAAVGLRDDPPGAVVVTGGDRLFAAGAEISEFTEPGDAHLVVSQAEAETLGGAFLSAINAVADIPRVTIASISGYALGGGCELALACDLRIGSEKAKLGQPEILLGIIPGGGGTQRLARLVGPAKAKDLILSGRQVGAEEALAMGLVDEVVAPEELEAHVLAKAATFAARCARRPGPGQAGHRPRPRRSRSTAASTWSSSSSPRCSPPKTPASAWPPSSSTAPARRSSATGRASGGAHPGGVNPMR